MQVLLFLVGILFAAIVAGLSIMIATPPDQAAHALAAYFRAAEWKDVTTWIEAHPGAIIYVLSGCLVAAILCLVLTFIIGIIAILRNLRKFVQRRRRTRALNTVHLRINELLRKSFTPTSFATTKDFYEAVDNINRLVQQQLTGRIAEVEIHVILDGTGGPRLDFKSGMGEKYTDYQNHIFFMRERLARMVEKYV